MKRFEHPESPGVIVEADEQRELLLIPSGWVEVKGSARPTSESAK